MTEAENEDVGFAGDEREKDWLAEAQANCDVVITDADVGWASKAFLAIVMISAKFGRRAGEARLAHMAADRRALLAEGLGTGATTPQPRQSPEKCGINHCPGLMDWEQAPGFKLGKQAMAMAESTFPNHTLKVKICRSCRHVHEATKL